MSWTEIFPIFDDDMLERYQKEAAEREKRAMAALFAVESIHNEKKVRHVIATSLFWKPACLGEADFPTPSKAVMENPGSFENPRRKTLLTVACGDRWITKILRSTKFPTRRIKSAISGLRPTPRFSFPEMQVANLALPSPSPQRGKRCLHKCECSPRIGIHSESPPRHSARACRGSGSCSPSQRCTQSG